MINGICQVLFKTVSGENVQVNMDKYSFAHLVSFFLKKKASLFHAAIFGELADGNHSGNSPPIVGCFHL